MTEDPKKTREQNSTRTDGIGRRDFVAMSVTAGLAASAACSSTPESAPEEQASIVETDVNITTPDGICDAAYIHPSSGSYPAVLIWPDAFGLRPTLRDMAKRLAMEGYSVLVPNPYYRLAKAPVFTDVPSFSFQNQEDRAKLTPLMGSINAEGAAEKDATAFIAFLDAQPEVDAAKKVGTQGYCMGGPLIMRTAAAVPDRVGAAASFHGGGLVTANPNSPHLLAPKIKARMYFGIAASDDNNQPDAKDKLREAFAAVNIPAEIEVYAGCAHGWCIADMPPQNDGSPTYSMPDAERAWGKLVELYKAALV